MAIKAAAVLTPKANVLDVIRLFSFANPRIGPIVLDASLSESHSVDVRITDNPVELGGDVSDHAQVQPRRVQIDGVVVSFPNSLLPVAPFGFTRHIKAWRMLRDMGLRHEVVDVVTTLEIYPRMMIESLRTQRTPERALRVTIVMRQLEVAFVDVAQQLADAMQDMGLGQAELGAQGTQAALSAELQALTF